MLCLGGSVRGKEDESEQRDKIERDITAHSWAVRGSRAWPTFPSQQGQSVPCRQWQILRDPKPQPPQEGQKALQEDPLLWLICSEQLSYCLPSKPQYHYKWVSHWHSNYSAIALHGSFQTPGQRWTSKTQVSWVSTENEATTWATAMRKMTEDLREVKRVFRSNIPQVLLAK